MSKTYYHATTEENVYSIMDDGEIHAGCDGLVYMCINPDHAARFAAVHGLRKIFVLKINIPDNVEVVV